MFLYNKSNTSSFRNHVVTDHKIIFNDLVLTWMGEQILWMVMMTPPLREVWIPIYLFGKYQMLSPLMLV